MLMKILGVDSLEETPLSSNKDFSAIFDFSATKLPQLKPEDFDKFYDEWLRRSGRQNGMDEYGQVIFLKGRRTGWNSKAYHFVLCERA